MSNGNVSLWIVGALQEIKKGLKKLSGLIGGDDYQGFFTLFLSHGHRQYFPFCAVLHRITDLLTEENLG